MKQNTEVSFAEFKKFLDKHRCEQSDITHTILAKGGGKFCFEGRDYQEFLSQYVQLVKENENDEVGYDFHFVERPNKNGVTYLFIDVDYDQKGSERLYTQSHIKHIIKKTNEFLRDNFDVTNKQLLTFITEKTCPTKRDKQNPNSLYKDGFHICYPNLPMEEKHRFYVIDHLASQMVEGEFLDGIKYKNAVDKIFDTSIVKTNGILMIGSTKEGREPYRLTHVYDSRLKDKDIDEYDDEELIYTLSNQRYDVDAKVNTLDDDEIHQKIENVYESYGGGTKNKKKTKTKSTTCSEDSDRDNNSQDDYVPKRKVKKRTVEDERNTELAKELVNILSKKRASEYVSWKQIGFALRAIDDDLFDVYVKFSKKNMEKYMDRKVTCEDIWKAAEKYKQYYTIGTLRHWARMDNHEKYNEIIRRLNDEVFGKAETGKHVDIAQVVYEFYKDRFVCIDIEKNKWFEYQDHRWVFVQSAYTLEDLISDEVRRMLTRYCSDKMRESSDEPNYTSTGGFMKDMTQKRYSKLMSIAEKLGDVGFRNNIIRACANKFYDSGFQKKLDSNVYLVGFLNGVYDLKELCFRDGLPSDYVAKTVGYEWEEYDERDPIFKKINKFFAEVQIDEDMRTYVLTLIAKCLRGVPDTKVHIWTGGGGNGKSATIDLIKAILGDYFGVLPVTVLTRKRANASNATPELADKYGKRFLVIQEPEHNDVMYVGQMKEITGKDTIQARPLYGDPFEYQPQFVIVLTCNNLPTIPATDNGTWRRLRVVPFESEFVDDEPTEANQFMKDEDLQEEFEEWRQPFMWLILTKYYPIYKKGYNGKSYKIVEPNKVKEHTKEYKLDSDMFAEFIDGNLVATGNKQDTETMDYVYKMFKDWYVASYSDSAPDKKKLVGYLKKNKYSVDKRNIHGVKIDIGIDLE